MTTLRIATFNCEWRGTTSNDGRLIRERVLADEPDVLCLTETQSDFLEGNGHTIASAQFDMRGKHARRRKVLLWSRKPWTFVDSACPAGLPEARYAAGTTKTPAGEIRVIGVVIPYRFAGVRYGNPKRRTWELHLEYLDALGCSLPEELSRTVLLGDFNQRVPRKYQPQAVFDSLDDCVLRRFEIATAGVLHPVQRQTIDHICHTPDLVCRGIRSISNERSDGGKISDHFGVCGEFAKSSTFGGGGPECR